MAALKRLDLMVRANSTKTHDEVIDIAKNWANKRQEQYSNKNGYRTYIYLYYVDVYDSRDSNMWKVFSDEAAKRNDVKNTWTKENGEVVKGVITVLNENIIRNIAKSNIPLYDIYKIDMETNPYEYKDEYKFIIAETDNEIAELRVDENKIYAYNADAFAENKQLLDISKNPTKLKLIVFK
jgi:hypothetical protein